MGWDRVQYSREHDGGILRILGRIGERVRAWGLSGCGILFFPFLVLFAALCIGEVEGWHTVMCGGT